jgi:glycerol-3-phosphate acyltransferase PlsY
MTSACLLPFVALVLGEPWPVLVFATIAALVVLVLHRANIGRLRAGTETRFRLRRERTA